MDVAITGTRRPKTRARKGKQAEQNKSAVEFVSGTCTVLLIIRLYKITETSHRNVKSIR